MKLQDALQVFGFTGEMLEADITTTYRQLVKKYHPDRNPAGLQMMQAVNAARDTLKNAFVNGWDVKSGETNNAEYGDDLNDAINAVIDLEGIKIEICGAWIWIGGNTKEHKDVFKKAGYKFAGKKKKWFFRPENYKSKSRGKLSMDEVRELHGSKAVSRPERKAIAA